MLIIKDKALVRINLEKMIEDYIFFFLTAVIHDFVRNLAVKCCKPYCRWFTPMGIRIDLT
jgi:hypothetical protein